MNWRQHPLLAPLKARWISWRSGTRIVCRGEGHSIQMAGALLYGARIELIGTGNTLTIGAGSRLWGSTIQLRGDNLRCHIGRNCRLRQTVMVIEDQGSRIDVGDESSGTACTLLACEGGLVQIGRDCMMSVASDIRNSDGHSVIELVSGERVNPAADVIVEDHAWIGLRVQILKGVRVGGHSIAAAGSVVVKDVPPNTIVAGIPARPIRSGITWIRERIPVRDVAEIQSVN